MRRTLIAAALAAGAWLGCGDDEGTGLAITQLRIEGAVSSLGDGEPVANAVVILQFPLGGGLGSRSAVTNGEGRYVLIFTPDLPVDCRDLALSVSAAGFEPAFEDDVQCTGALQVIDFELQPAGG